MIWAVRSLALRMSVTIQPGYDIAKGDNFTALYTAMWFIACSALAHSALNAAASLSNVRSNISRMISSNTSGTAPVLQHTEVSIRSTTIPAQRSNRKCIMLAYLCYLLHFVPLFGGNTLLQLVKMTMLPWRIADFWWWSIIGPSQSLPRPGHCLQFPSRIEPTWHHFALDWTTARHSQAPGQDSTTQPV